MSIKIQALQCGGFKPINGIQTPLKCCVNREIWSDQQFSTYLLQEKFEDTKEVVRNY